MSATETLDAPLATQRTIKQQIILVMAISLAITCFTWGFSGYYTWQNFLINWLFNGTLTVLLWFGNVFVAERVPYSWVDHPRRRFWITFAMMLLLVFVATGVARSLSMAVCCGVWPWEAIRTTQLVDLITIFLITALISAFVHGNRFWSEWKASVVAAEQLKQAYLESEYEILKQQVNPHFLFNSLNVLHTLVYKDADQAARFIRLLAKVYRYVLDGRRKEEIEVREELSVLEAYYHLVRTRFGESLQLRLENREKLQDQYIVPLSLQLLFENVVKHNDFTAERPMTVVLRVVEDYLWMENPLRRRREKVDTTGLGLDNIRQRYRHLTGREVLVVQTEDQFRVGLPLIPNKYADTDH